MRKRERHKAILELVSDRAIANQESLRRHLRELGIQVAQATLSRDMRELGLVKRADPSGRVQYQPPASERLHAATLQRLLPDLYLSSDGTGNLLLLRTRTGGAQPVGAAMDADPWPEVLGTIAGDDTVLVILRRPRDLAVVRARIESLAGEAPLS